MHSTVHACYDCIYCPLGAIDIYRYWFHTTFNIILSTQLWRMIYVSITPPSFYLAPIQQLNLCFLKCFNPPCSIGTNIAQLSIEFLSVFTGERV